MIPFTGSLPEEAAITLAHLLVARGEFKLCALRGHMSAFLPRAGGDAGRVRRGRHPDPPNAPMSLQATGYSMESKEWSSVGSEGFADFFGARIFNDYAVEAGGVFHRTGTTYDLEKWDSSNTQRGYLRNVCCSGSNCASSLDGAGTRQDWMRAFWDLYTYASCSPSTDRLKMLQFWNALVEQPGIANDVWFPKSQDGMDDLIDAGTLGSCYATRWDYYGCWNGIDYQGGLPSGSC